MAKETRGRLNSDVRHAAQWGVLCTAIDILHRAWPHVKKDSQVSTASHEDEITDVLRRRMSLVKKKMNPPSAMRFERESQSDAADDDTELGLIDIMVCYSWNEETHLVIECKRISSTENRLAKKYVELGVCRFASGKYSAGHAYGVMVGYVLCQNAKGCTRKIREQLESQSGAKTGYDASFGWKTTRKVINSVSVGKSRHQQKSHRFKITLIHTLVEF